jgi:hypothetical protein
MDDVLRYGVIVSFLISIAALAYLMAKTIMMGKNPLYARDRGKPIKGILYALSLGLAPWEKESAAKHLPTYIAGILYHFGIFAAIAQTTTVVFEIILTREMVIGIQILLGVGVLCGFGLLFKRLIISQMREISCPDDFISNILVNIFLVCACIHTFFQSFRSVFFLSAILLFLYMPIGKIRHCFFFFFSRVLFGRFFGRRGVLPHGQGFTRKCR